MPNEKKSKKDSGMGVGLGDLLFPFLLPIKGIVWIGEKIQEVAETELSDKSKIKEELLELQMRLEMEEITEKEYDKKEAELLARLNAIKKTEEEKQ